MNIATYPFIALLRHAEAQNPSMNMRDFDRPLTSKGIKQANLVGHKIDERIKKPLIILCSPALRTKQTLENLNLNAIAEIHYLNLLYEGNVSDYIYLINQYFYLPLLLIGHNPTIAQTAYRLWDKKQDKQKFPLEYETASLTIFTPSKNNSQNIIENSNLVDAYRP